MAQEKKEAIDCLPENLKLFGEIGKKKNYRNQAIFFLNAFWTEYGEKEAEKVWDYVQTAGDLDQKQADKGYALDEFEAHRFLEKYGQALTVVAMRQELKKIDIDSDHKMSLLEYVVYHYKLSVDTLMTRPQGVNEEVEKAEVLLEEVLEEIAKIEKKKRKLSKKAAKNGGQGVKAKAAANELEQLKAADPIHLRRALVSAQAAIRKAQKSKNLNAMGKLWFINKETEEAAKYKPKADWKRTHFDPDEPTSP